MSSFLSKFVVRRPLWVVLGLLGTAALTVFDLHTKDLAIEHLSEARTRMVMPVCEPDPDGHIYMQRFPTEPVILVDEYLELRYAENCGAAFSLLRTADPLIRKTVFGLAATLASIWLLWSFVRTSGRVYFAWAVPFIVSGALGNLFDRMRLGYVIDFIRFHIREEWAWPTFNVADCTITVGVTLLILDMISETRRERRASATKMSS